MDTPKPEMREIFPGGEELLARTDILKMEIDHHLEADSAYNGDEPFCLVDEASSACELVGLLAFKMNNHPDIRAGYDLQDLFSRNFVLAVLTGIIGDSKMGKYLKTSREKWFYRLFSGLFNEMLVTKTHKDSLNFSTMDQVFSELQQLSRQEDECFSMMMEQRRDYSPQIGAVVVLPDVMATMRRLFDHEIIVSVARFTADTLAEQSRKLSLVAYYDDQEESGLIQFRVRRSQAYSLLDLRRILDKFGIENGGGHPGAIGFRIPQSQIPDPEGFVRELIAGIEDLMKNL